MNIAIGTDHCAINYKDPVIKYLEEKGHNVQDFGTNSAESCDYTDYAKAVAESVASGQNDIGILMCGTGIGMSIAANKVKGIRAAVVPNVDYAQLTHEHNDTNIICLSGRFMTLEECKACIDAYMNVDFLGKNDDESAKRHVRRINKIKQMEEENFK